METVIKVENLSKRYRLGLKEKKANTLVGQVSNLIKSPWQNLKRLQKMSRFVVEDESVFWALKDINFEVKAGEVLGIIGKNGAGKSTLLKILSQITDPSSGKIEIHGRVASLLEVGTGFHPELSGRENIYMNGTILGMTRREIDLKLDEIIDFSGVEKFIDTPVKFYSSGMKVRLGFSVAAHLEPEILIIDEVLAVGDYEFQAKCLGKMEEVSHQFGRTVLFVSHDLKAIKSLCPTSLLLDNGEIYVSGMTDFVLSKYTQKNKEMAISWDGSNLGYGLSSIKLFLNGNEPIYFNHEVVLINVYIKCISDISDLVIGFNLMSEYGYPIARINYNDYQEPLNFKSGLYKFLFKIPSYSLATGKYYIDFDIAIPYVIKLVDENSTLSFEIISSNKMGDFYGIKNNFKHNSLIRTDWFEAVEIYLDE